MVAAGARKHNLTARKRVCIFHNWAVIAALVCAASTATAQRYTAKQDGDVVALADTVAKMNAMSSPAWARRTAPSLEAFEVNSGLTGMPLLAPFANRLDETAFYADGKKYEFDLGLGNVRRPIPGTGYVNGWRNRIFQEEDRKPLAFLAELNRIVR